MKIAAISNRYCENVSNFPQNHRKSIDEIPSNEFHVTFQGWFWFYLLFKGEMKQFGAHEEPN